MADVPEALVSLDPETKQPPETRLKDAAKARALIVDLLQEDEPRSRQRAMVKGMVDGNNPYPSGSRPSWMPNLNFMEGQALMDSSSVPYYAILDGVETYAECCTAYQRTNTDWTDWNRKISNRFHGLIKRWNGFDWHIQQASYQMRLHGIGPVLFDPVGWKFRSLDAGKLLVPKGSPSNLDARVPYCVVRLQYRVHELYDLIRKEESAKTAGWNPDAVKDAIINCCQGKMGENVGTQWRWEQYQQELRENSLWVSKSASDFINCAHLFYIEMDGKVSHVILTEGEIIVDSVKKPDRFLYRKLSKYDSYDEALIAFLQDSADGTWHSVRGLATKAFKHLSVSNQLMNDAITRTKLECSLILKNTSKQNAEKQQLTRFGAITVLPPGCNLEQVQVSRAVESAISMGRVLSSHLANNIGMFNQRTIAREDGRGEAVTAAQINAQVAKESTLNQGQMSLFFETLDRLYHEMFRRAVKSDDDEAKRFRKECEDDGVPAEALKDMDYVRANRMAGYGSPQMRQLTDQQMMPVVAMLPEKGKQAFLEDYVGSVKGAEKVARYVPKETPPGNDEWAASIENDSISNGNLPPVVSGQSHVNHLQIHLEHAETKLGPLKEAMDQDQQVPREMLAEAERYTSIMAQHCQEHIRGMSGDTTRTELARYFEQQLNFIVSFSGQLRRAVIMADREAALAAQEEQQAIALGAMDQAKIESQRTNDALKIQKTNASVANNALRTAETIRLQRIKTAEEIRLNRERQRAERVRAA